MNTAVNYHSILTLEKVGTVVNYHGTINNTGLCADAMKHFTAVIYCHSMVTPSFCVLKLFCLINYRIMTANYQFLCNQCFKQNFT
jgi:hypothetical protein